MVNKVIELRDIYDNVLLPYAHAAVRDGDNNIITSTYATIQTVNTKQDIITGAASSITSSDLDPSKVVVSNISGKITTAPITSTELGYLSGATENIPTAINTIKDMLIPEDASAGDALIINDDKTALVPGGSIYHPALFSYQPADHLLNDIQWLRADTFSWQSGDVYKAAYDHLVNDFDSYWADKDPDDPNNWFHETIGSNTIWYTLAADGHKIVLTDHEDTAVRIYNEVGDAWYYILDQENIRFKLPRRKNHGDIVEKWNNGSDWYKLYADGWVEQGGKASVANANSWTTVNLLIPMRDTNYFISDSLFSDTAYWANQQPLYVGQRSLTSFLARCNQNTSFVMWEVNGYSSRSVNDNKNKYLYFYVGEFTQSAIQETAGITVEVLNDKLDADLGNSKYSKFDAVIDYQEPTASNNYTWYRLYKSGWVEQGGSVVINSASVAGGNYATTNITFPITLQTSRTWKCQAKHDRFNAGFTNTEVTSGATVYQVNDSGSSFANPFVIWEVKGFAAR